MIALSTTIDHLKKIFIDPSKDRLSLEEVYIVTNRSHFSEKQNKDWIRNLLHYFRHYGLAKPLRKKTNMGFEITTGLQLTEEGKNALNWTNLSVPPSTNITTNPVDVETSDHATSNGKPKASFEDAARIIEQLREENPSFDITFDVRMKNG